MHIGYFGAGQSTILFNFKLLLATKFFAFDAQLDQYIFIPHRINLCEIY